MDRKLRVLIIDDAPANIKMLGQALKDYYQVIVANNGQAGLKICQSDNPPDLILLDINMPEMDGYEVCQRLKSVDSTSSIPVIFLTANDTPGEEERGLELGAVDFITKPFSIPLVMTRVEAHLRNSKLTNILRGLQKAAPEEIPGLLSGCRWLAE